MITNLKELLDSIKKYGERTAFRYKTGKDTVCDVSYNQLIKDVKALGTTLNSKSNGLKNKHIAILSENSYEWIVSYLAVTCGGGVAVPIDRDLPEEAICHLLEQGDASAVLYSTVYDEIIKKANIPALKYFICFKTFTQKEEAAGSPNSATDISTDKFLTYENAMLNGNALLDKGDVSFEEVDITADDLAGILFTSGTTGFSKGVMLTHKNIVSNIFAATSGEKYGEHDVMFSVLPYHHAFECTVGLLASLTFGATVCINDSIKYFAKNLAFFKPTAMFSVPAIINAMYKKAQAAEKLIGFLAKGAIKKKFGGNLERIFSGSAPLKPELIHAFKNYGIRLCQGYGLTETSPVVSMAVYDKLNDKNINTVGEVIPGCEVKIEENEILVKGDNVMRGYYKNPEATADVFKDGWFKTGDLGYLDDEGFLYINGRKKNVIIASGGENVYPEEIEQFLYNNPNISDAMVYGDGEDKTLITAVIYPNYEALGKKSDEKIKAIIDKAVSNVNAKLPIYKNIIYTKIRKTEFEKTTSKKVKRNENNTLEI
ncbi:MAG: AMP-binding protein [Oscillospiraceae bacterium]|nr:AMP-binding protein [Oscillospiraceae bacterium]